MNLLNEIEKDAKQFMRERRTLMLLVAAPLLVLFIMGAIFSGSSATVGRTAIGICDLDGSDSSVSFINGISNSSDIVDYSNSSNCSGLMENEVKSGKIAAGLVIPENFESGIKSGNTQMVSILLDNSRFQITGSIEAFVKANVQDMDKKIGTEFILSVWQRLSDANDRLGTLYSDINDTRIRAQNMKLNLRSTADSLNSLNITSIRNELIIASDTVSKTAVSLEQAETNLTKIEENFVNYTVALSQTESDLVEINNTLANASGSIAAAKSGINCSDIVFAAYCLSIDTLNASLENAQLSVEQRIDKVRQAQESLKNANSTVQEFKANIASAKIEVIDSQEKISNMMEFVDELENNRAEALQTISDVDNSLDEMVEKTYELEEIVLDSRSQINEITSSSPEFIISPMLVASNNLFGARPFFEFMLPSVLPLILMFVCLFLSSTSLVKEKYIGTLERAYISQVNPYVYVATKVASYSIVLIPETIMLALVASLAYNAFDVGDADTWINVIQSLVLLTAAFVSIGLIVAIYSESEATAFLASLVIGLPLLFLSGILFPLEFMPPLVSFFATLSPLTQAIISMQATLLYQSPQITSSIALLGYIAIFTALAGTVLKK